MENIRTLWTTCTVWLLFLGSFSTAFYSKFETHENPSIIYTYNRFAEIKDKCGIFLSRASELAADDNRGSRIKEELSFSSGEWNQNNEAITLVQFHENSLGDSCSKVKLVSFSVVDVSSVRQSNKTVSISGKLRIGVAQNERAFSNYMTDKWSPSFHVNSEGTIYTMLFEGVYVESEDNGGERILCMLGTAAMPSFSDDLETVNGYGYGYTNINSNNLLAQDDQIMLVLRYPKTFTLTTNGISGELKSLNGKTNATYFDTFNIYSLLDGHNKYHFGAEGLLQKACHPYPYEDSLVDQEIVMNREDQFCENIQPFLFDGLFSFSPKWEIFSKSDGSDKLGPFILPGGMKASTEYFNNFRLLIQDFRCEQSSDEINAKTANVSAAFRLIYFEGQRCGFEERTHLSGMTLSAEGMWKSSSGQLCMVGCIGLVGEATERCNSRICLYLPHTFSIHQRSTIFGTISSINRAEESFLYFEVPINPNHLISKYQRAVILHRSEEMPRKMVGWSYKYSKTMEVIAFQNRTKLSILGNYMKSLFSYPSLKGGLIANLSSLSDELSFVVAAVPFDSSNGQSGKVRVGMEVLSLGPLFGRCQDQSYSNCQDLSSLSQSVSNNGIEVSGFLSTISSYCSCHSTLAFSLSFEGIYDPRVGEMYLVGCKNIMASVSAMKNGTKLEGGKDCEIEIKVDYPPLSIRWLLGSKYKIFISSKRNREDSLYFSPIKLLTYPLFHYDDLLNNIIMRETVEGVLRIIMLTMAILCTWSQLYYASKIQDPAQASLVMLAIQALGYGIPLLTGEGNDILFKWKLVQNNVHTNERYDLDKYEHLRLIESAIRILLLVAFLLTLRIAQIVYRSCVRRSLNQKHIIDAASEKWVFLITLALHVGGFLAAHATRPVHSDKVIYHYENFGYASTPTSYNSEKFDKWTGEIDDYSGVVQDFFLLPQIVRNALWKLNGKPLCNVYYFGLTALRILLHVYDFINDTLPEPYYDPDGYQNMSLKFHSKFGNIMMAFIVVVLAFVVYLQPKCQKRN
ncbi:hypothetical protein L6164_016528 [Bauhinia variegata]|uniref:Uncharacterized protein n=1 Tax=Bauhinia variegata TaxID=167791 RepID=A0ACB9NRX7_BAUVA|nr:hypothetical protein L6164_016528 [Bauhinia variegata]